jgi:5-methylcytosine-specific restriction endonuclease McrA
MWVKPQIKLTVKYLTNLNKVLGIDLGMLNIIMKQPKRKYNYTEQKQCANPGCTKFFDLRIIGDTDSPDYSLPVLKNRKKITCSVKCQQAWQQSIPWEDRVGIEFATGFRKKMSILSSTNNPSTFPGVSEKISNGMKKYIADNPGIRSGENNSFFGKTHTDETKQYLKETKLGKWSYSAEQKNKQTENTPRRENHPNWQGGIANGEYGPEFNKLLKLEIKESYNFTCQLCNITNTDLDIHHIDYDKNNNISANLIPLCKTCHGKTNYNRNRWKGLLTEIKNRSNINDK